MSRVERKPPERFLSADEVAELLGMSRDWVNERALARDPPSYKLPGGKRRFLHSELMQAAKRFRERGGGSLAVASIRRRVTSSGQRRWEVRFAAAIDLRPSTVKPEGSARAVQRLDGLTAPADVGEAWG